MSNHLQEKFKDLCHPKWDTPKERAQERGRHFEEIVHELFKEHKVLLRGSYHTSDNKSEQIDGVIRLGERVALLEMKWVKKELAASALFSFLGKVESKFAGTIGVFISRNELSDNFLRALRSGRRQSIIVIHGNDVDLLFEPNFPVVHYLHEHIQNLCLDNVCHLTAAAFKESFAPPTASMNSQVAPAQLGTQAVPQPPAPRVDLMQDIFNFFITEPQAGNLARARAALLNPEETIQMVNHLLDQSIAIQEAKSTTDAWKATNLERLFIELRPQLPQTFTMADAKFFDSLALDFRQSSLIPFLPTFISRIPFLPDPKKKELELSLLQQWDDAFGEWIKENQLAVPTEALWEHMSFQTQTSLVGKFLSIILSERNPSFPQYKLSRTILQRVSGDPEFLAEIIGYYENRARESAEWHLKGEELDAVLISRIEKRLCKEHEAIASFLPDYCDRVRLIVKEAAARYAGPAQ